MKPPPSQPTPSSAYDKKHVQRSVPEYDFVLAISQPPAQPRDNLFCYAFVYKCFSFRTQIHRKDPILSTNFTYEFQCTEDGTDCRKKQLKDTSPNCADNSLFGPLLNTLFVVQNTPHIDNEFVFGEKACCGKF